MLSRQAIKRQVVEAVLTAYAFLNHMQVEKLQQQVSQAVAGRRSAESEALRRGATLKQLEHRLGELSSEKDVSSPSCACHLVKLLT